MTDPVLRPSIFPQFSNIAFDMIEPAIKQLIAENEEHIEQLVEITEPTWAEVVLPLEELEERLDQVWSPIAHLHSVRDTLALRKIYESCLEQLTAYHTRVGQHRRLYESFEKISKRADYKTLNLAQRKIVEYALRDFKLSGVALEEKKRNEVADLRKRLSKLCEKYGENVLDATDHWLYHFTEEEMLAGIPDGARALFKNKATEKGLDGWCIGLDFPGIEAVLTYAEHRELRKTVYDAYVTRASECGPSGKCYDNSTIMVEILQARAQMATLLDFRHFSEYSLATKMAPSPEKVLGFLQDLLQKARPFAEKELSALRQFARERYQQTEIEAWDLSFYREKLFQESFSISQEELRPYFPLPKVLEGLFEVVKRLFDISIQREKNSDVWDEAVEFFSLYHGKEVIGYFYLDPYARNHKQQGAWMEVARNRYCTGSKIQKPIAYLVCNFRAPSDNLPGLLTHDEVLTLFHEFGHGLHHLLTKVDYPSIAGIHHVPWDAIEIPSQLMENWCWEEEVLPLISGHYQTKEPIPLAVISKLKEARNFHAGMFLVRQLEYALFDFQLHNGARINSAQAIQDLLDAIRKEVAVLLPPNYNRFQHAFSHIFPGGYAAGYYSYLWAEVLSSDVYSKFKETGIFNRNTGLRLWDHILAKGGTEDPMILLENFLERAPSQKAFLQQYGLEN